MTFWDFFNNHPFVGLILACSAIFMGGLQIEYFVGTVGKILIARYALTHAEEEPADDEPDDEDDATELKSEEQP